MPPNDKELASAAVLEELRSDRNLMDGVVPDTPAPEPQRTTFALGCCQYPGGFLDGATAYASYRELVERLAAANDRPRFIILTGDQVYTDATAGVLDPSIADGKYVLPYVNWLRARAVRTALRQVHSFMLLDDHEIDNDWEGKQNEARYYPAIGSYMKYEGNPVYDSSKLFFDFLFDDFRFFMFDTRTRRKARSLENIDTADLFDGQGTGTQYQRLKDWLERAPLDQPKFIVSPSMLLPRHRDATCWNHRTSAIHSDSWDGFPASLHRMLALATLSDTEHVVFLSGDEHIGCIATITVKNLTNNTEKTLHSIHCPGLYTPYTFANSGVADWQPDVNIPFTVDNTDFEYTTTYTPFPGAAFVYLDVQQVAGSWHLTAQFGAGPIHPIF